MNYLLYALIGYCIGSIPTGWLVAYKAGINDITNHGSGNIGATNVGRFLGLPYFGVVLFIDCFKSFLFLWMLTYLKVDSLGIVAGAVSLLVGNSISIFLQGKGGKGVATSLGILLAINPSVIIYLLCIWLVTALITHNMGISCVAGLLMLPYVVWFFVPFDAHFFVLSFFMSIWGIWRHETNIRRYCASKKIKI